MPIVIWYLLLLVISALKTNKCHTASIDFNHTVCNSFMLILIISILIYYTIVFIQKLDFSVFQKVRKNAAAHGDETTDV